MRTSRFFCGLIVDIGVTLVVAILVLTVLYIFIAYLQGRRHEFLTGGTNPDWGNGIR